jgi:hypothetical protein
VDNPAPKKGAFDENRYIYFLEHSRPRGFLEFQLSCYTDFQCRHFTPLNQKKTHLMKIGIASLSLASLNIFPSIHDFVLL